MPAWQAGDLAIPLGVGYPRPNRSHFRSIEIWNSASDADALETEGWLSRLMANETERRGGIDGIVLGELGQGLAAFRTALQKSGAWQRVMVMTYAEFGRRVAQNASGGTDHGTAAAHLMLGGGLRGGLYGRQPSLTELDGGDLRHTLDFRQLYATAAHGWLGLPRAGSPLAGFAPLDLLT